jgi:hypothetical protein
MVFFDGKFQKSIKIGKKIMWFLFFEKKIVVFSFGTNEMVLCQFVKV